MTYGIFRDPQHGTVTVLGNVATYTPDPGYTGTDEFTFQASDGQLASNLGVIRIAVQDVSPDDDEIDPLPPVPNEPPEVWAGESIEASTDAPITFRGTVNDPDGPADIISIQWDLDNDGLTFQPHPSASGTLTPVHIYDTPGVYLVALVVTDSAGHSATDSTLVTIWSAEDEGSSGPVTGAPSYEAGDFDYDFGDLGGDPSDQPGGSGSSLTAFLGSSSGTTLTVGTTAAFSVTLSGAGSADAEVYWDFNYDTVNETFSYDYAAAELTAAHTFVGPGTYTVAVEVYTDFDYAFTTRDVTVLDVPTFVIDAGPDRFINEGQSTLFDARQLDLAGVALVSSAQWDFDYDGLTFSPDPSATGTLTSAHTFSVPGTYLVALRMTDTAGLTRLGTTYVTVYNLAPTVNAGADLTVAAGSTAHFSATASDPGGIASIQWDFDYDGEFTPNPAAAGMLAPSRLYPSAGEYTVVVRATDYQGRVAEDTLLVTVLNVAPSASVSVSGPTPEGAPVTFTVSSLGDIDPADELSIWVDWLGDGEFQVVESEEWTVGAGGAITFGHVYDDNSPAVGFPTVVRIVDVYGLSTDYLVPVVVTNVAPAGTFGPGPGVQPIDTYEALQFADVTDPSEEDAEYGFTYYYRVGAGAWVESDVPDFVLDEYTSGATYTVNAFIQDKDGGASPIYTSVVKVPIDTEFRNEGTGTVRLSWDGAAAPVTLGPNQTYDFGDSITGLTITLLTGGASYTLRGNADIASVNPESGVTNVTLEVRTDALDGLPEFTGSGNTQTGCRTNYWRGPAPVTSP